MLAVTPIHFPESRQDKITREIEGNGLTKTWVVSDLRSKFEIQKLILLRQGFYEDHHVLRASELWRLLLRRAEPELRVVSPDLILALVKDQLETLQISIGSASDQAICDFMDQFAPVIFHAGGSQQLRQWFEKNPRSFERWGAWYRLAEQFAPHFLGKKMLSPAWVSSVLLETLNVRGPASEIWNRPLIFDLGGELKQTESDLIQMLARSVDCEVLVPSPPFAKKYEALLMPYDHLPVRAEKAEAEVPARPKNSTQKTLRFSGLLAEIKHAVSQSRAWVEAGVALEKIAILAPDIETYWPLLSEMLRVEGLPAQKDSTSRLQSLPVVHQWLATIRIRSGVLDSGQLETAIYGPELPSRVNLRVEEFRASFRNLFGFDDLVRSVEIEKFFGVALNADRRLSVEEFLGSTLPFWTRLDLSETLEILLKDLLAKVATGAKTEMKLSNWLFLLERLIAKKEIKIHSADSTGLLVANLAQGDAVSSTHRIFLGLSQSQLSARSLAWILSSEIHSFNRDHGFYLMNPEASLAAFELEWLGLAGSQEDHFCYPGTQWDGTLETPSQFWMEKRLHESGLESIHQVQVPGVTRWDELQLSVSPADLQTNPQELSLAKSHHLSASSLQRFRDCPFIFFAEKSLQLLDPPELDLDLDRRSKGRLIHSVLEKMTAPEHFLRWTAEELRELLEAERSLLPPGFIHDGLWLPLRERNVSLALKFQEQERAWHERYPKSQILAREAAFDFEHQGFRFKGVMDRIDGDDKRAVVLDYKTSEASVKTFNRWFTDNQLQLGFYAWILENGFVEAVGGRQVVGAFFYVLKTLDRSTGFKTVAGSELLDIERRKSHITEEAKVEFMQKLEEEILAVTSQIKAGQFSPRPRDIEICDRCQWRGLCRAPHLL